MGSGSNQAARLSSVRLAAYAMPAFAFAIPTIPVYVLLPAVYADTLGLGLAATGTALVISRGLDMLSDPLIGLLSDRTRSRFGRRKPWILAGALVAALGFARVALPPADVDAGYLTVWLVVLSLGWTAVVVPYTAWGAELTPGYDERVRVTTAREGAGLAGLVFASLMPALAGGEAATQLGLLALTAVGLGVIGLTGLGFFVPDRSTETNPSHGAPVARGLGSALSAALANGPFVRLIAAWFVNGLANGLPAALFLLYLNHGLGAPPDRQPLFILAYFVSAMTGLPLWYGASLKFGKHRAWCCAMIAACLAFALVPFLAQGQFVWFSVVCIVTGLALGADLVLPPALQADVVDFDRLRHGDERTGLYFALWHAATKLAMALSAGLGLIGASLAGFDPAQPTPRGVMALTTFYAVLPVGLKLVAVALLWRFPITARRHKAIRRQLARRMVQPPD